LQAEIGKEIKNSSMPVNKKKLTLTHSAIHSVTEKSFGAPLTMVSFRVTGAWLITNIFLLGATAVTITLTSYKNEL
jgi:hypothetical protein